MSSSFLHSFLAEANTAMTKKTMRKDAVVVVPAVVSIV